MSDDLELRWEGKYDASGGRRPPERPEVRLELLERHGHGPSQGTLVLGDNLGVLAHWETTHAGTIDVVYMDPPFMMGKGFQAVRTLGPDADTDAATRQVKVPGYEDRWSSRGAFVSMLDDRLRLARGLLAAHGSLYLHLDATMGHAAKLLADEVFGTQNFQREIIWRIGWVSGFKSRVRNWVRNHDTIFFYARDSSSMHFERQFVPYPPGYRRRKGAPSANPGIPMDDVWNANASEAALTGTRSLDSIQIKSLSREKTGWATQKNESLLERIVLASSRPGGWVVDPFAGAGTTAVVAARLGRSFLTCDQAPLAVQLSRARLLAAGVSFDLVRATSPAVTAETVDPGARLEVSGESGSDGVCTVTLHAVHLDPPEGVGVAAGTDAGPCWTVASWCLLDDARRVLRTCARACDTGVLTCVALTDGERPEFLRVYGVFGDILEASLEWGADGALRPIEGCSHLSPSG